MSTTRIPEVPTSLILCIKSLPLLHHLQFWFVQSEVYNKVLALCAGKSNEIRWNICLDLPFQFLCILFHHVLCILEALFLLWSTLWYPCSSKVLYKATCLITYLIIQEQLYPSWFSLQWLCEQQMKGAAIINQLSAPLIVELNLTVYS